MDIALKILLLLGLIGAIATALIMWLNSSDAEQDNESYETGYDARKKIPFANTERVDDAQLWEDHEQALKAYELPVKHKRAEAEQVKVTVKAPAAKHMYMQATAQPADVIDAEEIKQAEFSSDPVTTKIIEQQDKK